MKKIFFIIILFLNLSLSSKNILKEYLSLSGIEYKNKSLIIVALNGNDCTNCYRSVSDFIIRTQELEFQDLYFIVSGISEREKSSFIKNNFSKKIVFNNFIINNDFSYYLNNHSSTTISLIKNGKITKTYDSKTLINFDYKSLCINNSIEKKGLQLIDSIDVSNKIASKVSKCELMGKTKFILTDFRSNKIFSIENNNNHYDSLDIGEFLNSNYKKILIKALNDSSIVNESIELQSKMENFYNGNNLYFLSSDVVDNKIYISYRYLYCKKYKDVGAIGLMLPFILILDENLKPIENIIIPPHDLNDKTTYFDLINPHFNKKQCLLRITSGKSDRDTLMALFNIEDEKAVFQKYYNYTLKEYIPKKGNNNYPMFYYMSYYINGVDTFAFVSKDFTLKNINSNTEIEIPNFKKIADKNEYYSLNKIYNNNEKVFVWSNESKNTSSFSYFTKDLKKQLSKFDTQIIFNSIGSLTQSIFFGLCVTDNLSKIYLFKVD